MARSANTLPPGPPQPQLSHISNFPILPDPSALETGPDETNSNHSGSEPGTDPNTNVLTLPSTAPLLPAEILKPLPSPAQSLQPLPWSRMTRAQKRAERNRSRGAKKEVWMRLREGLRATGVVEAGRAAQVRRAVVGVGMVEGKGQRSVGRRRVEKVERRRVSGRERLVGERVRRAGVVGQTGHTASAKLKSKAKAKAKG